MFCHKTPKPEKIRQKSISNHVPISLSPRENNNRKKNSNNYCEGLVSKMTNKLKWSNSTSMWPPMCQGYNRILVHSWWHIQTGIVTGGSYHHVFCRESTEKQAEHDYQRQRLPRGPSIMVKRQPCFANITCRQNQFDLIELPKKTRATK